MDQVRFKMKAMRFKLKDMVQRKFDLYFSYEIVKWRKNKLKLYAMF